MKEIWNVLRNVPQAVPTAFHDLDLQIKIIMQYYCRIRIWSRT